MLFINLNSHRLDFIRELFVHEMWNMCLIAWGFIDCRVPLNGFTIFASQSTNKQRCS